MAADKKQREVQIDDIGIPGDFRIKDKQQEKMERYKQLKEEIRRLWNINQVTAILFVIGAHQDAYHISLKVTLISLEFMQSYEWHKRQHSWEHQVF